MGGSSALGALLCSALFLAFAEGNNEELTKISSGCSAFGQRLFQQFENKSNVVYSPLSVYLGLGMARLGAKGQTRQDLSTSLGLETTDENEQELSVMRAAFSSARNARVLVANKIFIQEQLALDPKFNEVSQRVFEASAENIDFNAPAAADVINNWVENATANKIQDIADKDSLIGTSVMLVNVLYFHGEWKNVFNLLPDPLPFHLDKDTTIDAYFMKRLQYCGHASPPGLDADLISISYLESTNSLVIILPKKIDGLSELEKEIARRSLPELFGSVGNREIDLHVPKFKLEMTANLKDPLKQMGLGNIFSTSADFTGMTGGDLTISKVLQKTYFDINENGTEAAAATAIRFYPKLGIMRTREPITIKCDRPFLFYLVHKKSLVLFAGKFVDPRIKKVEL